MEEGFLYWPLAITQHAHLPTHVPYTPHTKSIPEGLQEVEAKP